MLRDLGHEVLLAAEQGLHGQGDGTIVNCGYALDCIVITHDLLHGEHGVEVARQIRTRGGKVICVHGGPDQEPEQSVGRILFHWHEWYPRLSKWDGLVEIGDLRHPTKWYPRSKIHTRIRETDQPAFEQYLRKKAEERHKPLVQRKKKVARQQRQWDIGSGSEAS
jgi:hypothetical protein